MFARDAAKQRAVWDYMRFATGPQGQAILAQMTGYAPINLIAVRDPQYLGAFYAATPHQRMVGERMAIATDWYSFANNPVRIFDAMSDEMRGVLLQQTTPEQALASMASTARRFMHAV
jgi:multiple sugar transport system substrate-binding protein